MFVTLESGEIKLTLLLVTFMKWNPLMKWILAWQITLNNHWLCTPLICHVSINHFIRDQNIRVVVSVSNVSVSSRSRDS